MNPGIAWETGAHVPDQTFLSIHVPLRSIGDSLRGSSSLTPPSHYVSAISPLIKAPHLIPIC